MTMQTKKRLTFLSHVLKVDLCFMPLKIHPSKIVFVGRITSGYEQIKFKVKRALIKTTPGLSTGRFSVTIAYVLEPQAKEQVSENIRKMTVSVIIAYMRSFLKFWGFWELCIMGITTPMPS